MGDFAFGGLEQILQQLTEHYQPVFQRTSRSTLDSLPRLKVPTPEQHAQRSSAGKGANHEPTLAACRSGEACTVCHDEFAAGAEVVQLPCRHCFHDTCIRPWLEGHNTCPVCRTALPAESAAAGRSRSDPGQQAQPGTASGPMGSGGLADMMDQLVGSFMAGSVGTGAHAGGVAADVTADAAAAGPRPGRPRPRRHETPRPRSDRTAGVCYAAAPFRACYH